MEGLENHTYWRGSIGRTFRNEISDNIGKMVANYGRDNGDGTHTIALGEHGVSVIGSSKMFVRALSVTAKTETVTSKKGKVAVIVESIDIELAHGETVQTDGITIDGLLEILDAIDLQVYPNG